MAAMKRRVPSTSSDPYPDRAARWRPWPQLTALLVFPLVEEARLATDLLANFEPHELRWVPAQGHVRGPLDELGARRCRNCGRESGCRSANRPAQETGTRIGVVAVGEARPIDDPLCTLRPPVGLVERDRSSGGLVGRDAAELCPVPAPRDENRTPFSVTVSLEPGCCAVAEGDDDGESRAIPMTATIATAAVTGRLATLIMLILPRSVAERRALAHRSVLVQRTHGRVRKPS